MKINSAKKSFSYFFRLLCVISFSLLGFGTTTNGQVVYLIDFGGGGFTSAQTTAGLVATSSPDLHGNYWNNSVGGPGGQPSNLSSLVSIANVSGGISLNWSVWGSGVATANMGVTTVPAGSALGTSPLNVATANADSVFTQSTTVDNQFKISGLIAGQTYDFSIFASRTATDNRYTQFTITGDSVLTQAVQTSGTNLSGTGLNYSTTPWDFSILPNAQGEITFAYRVGAATGSNKFAYINSMSISTIPEPSAGTLLGLGLLAFTLARTMRRR